MPELPPGLPCHRCGRLTQERHYDQDAGLCDECLSVVLDSPELRREYRIDYGDDDA